MGKDGKNSSRVTITLSVEQHEKLKRLSKIMDRSESWLGKHALELFLDDQERQGKLS